MKEPSLSSEERILDLLEEILESNCTPEEACANCPEMLGEVRRRLKNFRHAEAEIDSLFPSTDRAPLADTLTAAPNSGGFAPQIPGYDVEGILGRGGMGVVYKARQVKLNRIVALKMLLAGEYATQLELLRFVREAEAVAGLRHPNIVQVYDVGEVERRPYYTMEYVEGGSLAEKLAGLPQPVRDAAETLAVLARAVESAHQGSIVHRDLKPANILLTEDGTLKISDFGLARRVDVEGDLTMSGTRLGTPSYMAPEQMAGSSSSLGATVDIYSLGAMLYEMLTGHTPFRGNSLSELERQISDEEPVPPSNWNGKVPRDLETICLKCLEKDPQLRYSSAAHLADDLERFLRHEPIYARPVGRLERLIRWVRRKPAAAALLGMAFSLVVFVLAEGVREWTLASGRKAEKARLTARLESGIQFQQQGRYAESQAILGRLGDGGFEDLRKEIDQALDELKLIEELDTIAVNRISGYDDHNDVLFGKADADRKYEAVFTRLKFGSLSQDPQQVTERIRASNIKDELIAAFDDWAACTSDQQRRTRLLAIGRQADPDPAGWRDLYRNPERWNDSQTVVKLFETSQTTKEPVQLLRALADRMDEAGLETISFRRQVQRVHSSDFLANFALADALRKTDPAESVRYYQAALAIRPDAVTAHNRMGMALAALGRQEEAIEQYEQAKTIDPQFVLPYYNLGLIQAGGKQWKQAIESFRQAIQVDETFVPAHVELAKAFVETQRNSEAAAELRYCLEVLPQDDAQRGSISELLKLCEQGKPEKNE